MMNATNTSRAIERLTSYVEALRPIPVYTSL
jgi:hypothetical protein